MKIIVHTSDNPRIIVGKARNMQMIVEYQGSASNSNIIRCTETEFNALSSLDSKTIYAVTDNSDNLLYVYIGYDKLSLESETITKFGWVVNVSSVGYDTLYFFKDQSTANSWLQSPTAANAPLASTTVSNVGNTINLGKPQSGYYTLTTAIAAVPSASRKGGLCITFMVADGAWRTYRYKPATTTGWSTETNWEDTTSEIEEMLEELDDKKADKTGLHHSLGSGTSDGLAGTDVVDAEYTLRCTGDKMSNLGTGAAAIDTVKGNTLVWNQLIMHPSSSAWSSISAKGTISYNSEQDYLEYTVNNAESGLKGAGILGNQVEVNTNHKYYVFARLMMSKAGEVYLGGYSFSGISSRNFNLPQANTWVKLSEIFTNNVSTSGGTNYYFSIQSVVSGSVEIGDKLYIQFPMLIDLTKMFGSGYEPSTVAEFESLYPLSYYAYNAGTLINNSASGIKTIGFNQWDGTYYAGLINSNGTINTSSSVKHSDYIRVFPLTKYYINYGLASQYAAFSYDINYNFLGKHGGNSPNGIEFTTHENAAYVRINMLPDKVDKTCLNLSWSGYRNGEYEPYEEHTVYFDSALGASGSLATIKGRKLNAQGEPTGDSVVVFFDGMKSAGTAYDEAKGNTAIKRVGSVDLGTLTWSYNTNYNTPMFTTPLSSIGCKSLMGNLMCPLYQSETNFWQSQDNYNKMYACGSYLNISNQGYSDPAAFKSAMSGVILYYELATPETYLLDNPLPRCYAENKLGTEERLPKDTASAVNAPLKYTVKYPMNIAKNYVSADSISNLLTELATKFGAAMSKTITITPTFNENTQEFDYSITIT